MTQEEALNLKKGDLIVIGTADPLAPGHAQRAVNAITGEIREIVSEPYISDSGKVVISVISFNYGLWETEVESVVYTS